MDIATYLLMEILHDPRRTLDEMTLTCLGDLRNLKGPLVDGKGKASLIRRWHPGRPVT